MYTLHKLPEGFIITSDEKPIKGDLCFDMEGNPGHKNQLYIVKCLRTSDDSYWVKHSKKLIAQQDQIDFSNLTEEEQKEIGWFDKIINDNFKGLHDVINNEDISNFYIELIKTYTQEVLSDRNELHKIIAQFIDFIDELPVDWIGTGDWKSADSAEKDWKIRFEKFIQSLSQPKSWNIEIETEESSRYDFTGMPCVGVLNPKFTNGKIKITKIT
jgi:hypothetical protein